MAIEQKCHVYTIPWYGVILKRFYVGSSPDEVGTIEFWGEAIRQLFDQMPFLQYWQGLELEIWHMKSPDLVSPGKQTLLDYDPNTPGCQVAAGLTFGPKRICLGVFPDGWTASGGGSDTLTDANREQARKAFSHEAGHQNHFATDLDAANTIAAELRREWANLRPRQTENTHEDWAETYRALFGISSVRGTFSDGKPFTPGAKLFTFLKVAYWLGTNLKSRIVSGLNVRDTYVQWLRVDEGKYYALTNNWEQFVWNGASWVRV
jgi:hypothetical protein